MSSEEDSDSLSDDSGFEESTEEAKRGGSVSLRPLNGFLVLRGEIVMLGAFEI